MTISSSPAHSTGTPSSYALFPPLLLPPLPPPTATRLTPPSVHAITSRLNPHKTSPSTGLEVLETENFRMQCFNTLTGTKFLLFTDTTQANVDVTMRRVYELYCDYVMKNPFYQLEMPVRCDAFERRLGSYIREINSR